MRIGEIAFLYLCFGAAVALATRQRPRWLALVLWPLMLPALLARPGERFDTVPAPLPARPSPIDAALDRLKDAVRLWDAAPALPLESLRGALTDLESRRAALAAVLAGPDHAVDFTDGSDVARQRRANVAALTALRDQLASERDRALSRIDEVVTRIQLAHFGGRPLDDVAEQLAALVAAVEGMRAARDEAGGVQRPPRAPEDGTRAAG